MIDDDSIRFSIQSANKRASRLTNRLLDYSRESSPDEHAIDMIEFTNTLQTLISQAVPKRISWKIENNLGEQSKIQLDPGKLQQLFLDLVSNSVQATPDAGEIQITIGLCEVEDSESINLNVLPGSFVKISVVDNGEGMNPIVLENAFKPFFSTRAGIGKGIGLTNLQETIVAAGGTITIESKFGIGTEVTVLLPEHNCQALSAEFLEPLAETFQKRPAGSGQKVLLVEDRDSLRKAMHEAMEVGGFNVLSFDSAEEAWQLLSTGERFDCVISDINLCGMTGLGLYRIIRKTDLKQKVILMSKKQDRNHQITDIQARDLNFRFVQKPFLINKLLRMLEELNHPSGHIPFLDSTIRSDSDVIESI